MERNFKEIPAAKSTSSPTALQPSAGCNRDDTPTNEFDASTLKEAEYVEIEEHIDVCDLLSVHSYDEHPVVDVEGQNCLSCSDNNGHSLSNGILKSSKTSQQDYRERPLKVQFLESDKQRKGLSEFSHFRPNVFHPSAAQNPSSNPDSTGIGSLPSSNQQPTSSDRRSYAASNDFSREEKSAFEEGKFALNKEREASSRRRASFAGSDAAGAHYLPNDEDAAALDDVRLSGQLEPPSLVRKFLEREYPGELKLYDQGRLSVEEGTFSGDRRSFQQSNVTTPERSIARSSTEKATSSQTAAQALSEKSTSPRSFPLQSHSLSSSPIEVDSVERQSTTSRSFPVQSYTFGASPSHQNSSERQSTLRRFSLQSYSSPTQVSSVERQSTTIRSSPVQSDTFGASPSQQSSSERQSTSLRRFSLQSYSSPTKVSSVEKPSTTTRSSPLKSEASTASPTQISSADTRSSSIQSDLTAATQSQVSSSKKFFLQGEASLSSIDSELTSTNEVFYEKPDYTQKRRQPKDARNMAKYNSELAKKLMQYPDRRYNVENPALFKRPTVYIEKDLGERAAELYDLENPVSKPFEYIGPLQAHNFEDLPTDSSELAAILTSESTDLFEVSSSPMDDEFDYVPDYQDMSILTTSESYFDDSSTTGDLIPIEEYDRRMREEYDRRRRYDDQDRAYGGRLSMYDEYGYPLTYEEYLRRRDQFESERQRRQRRGAGEFYSPDSEPDVVKEVTYYMKPRRIAKKNLKYLRGGESDQELLDYVRPHRRRKFGATRRYSPFAFSSDDADISSSYLTSSVDHAKTRSFSKKKRDLARKADQPAEEPPGDVPFGELVGDHLPPHKLANMKITPEELKKLYKRKQSVGEIKVTDSGRMLVVQPALVSPEFDEQYPAEEEEVDLQLDEEQQEELKEEVYEEDEEILEAEPEEYDYEEYPPFDEPVEDDVDLQSPLGGGQVRRATIERLRRALKGEEDDAIKDPVKRKSVQIDFENFQGLDIEDLLELFETESEIEYLLNHGEFRRDSQKRISELVDAKEKQIEISQRDSFTIVRVSQLVLYVFRFRNANRILFAHKRKLVYKISVKSVTLIKENYRKVIPVLSISSWLLIYFRFILHLQNLHSFFKDPLSVCLLRDMLLQFLKTAHAQFRNYATMVIGHAFAGQLDCKH